VIKGLQGQLEESTVESYVDNFASEVQDDSLLVGKMSREQIKVIKILINHCHRIKL